MWLDYQILLKSSPLTLLAGSTLILTSHVVLYCAKRSLHKRSLIIAIHSGTLFTSHSQSAPVITVITGLTLTMDFSELLKHYYRFTHSSLHIAQNNVAYRNHRSLSRCVICHDFCVQWTHAEKHLLQLVLVNSHGLLPCHYYAVRNNNRSIGWTASSSLHTTRIVNLAIVQCECHNGK